MTDETEKFSLVDKKAVEFMSALDGYVSEMVRPESVQAKDRARECLKRQLISIFKEVEHLRKNNA